MSKYRVSFLPSAERQILEAYEWGVEFWGEEQAASWLRELYRATINRLAQFLMSCPLAPETSGLRSEVHQYVVGRYRVLFEVRDNEVIVLRLSGPSMTAGRM